MAGYGDDQKFEAWEEANGLTRPDGAPSSAALREQGSGYVDSQDFPGVPTGGLAQERAWPRTGAEAYGQPIPSDVIPVKIEHASYAAAYFVAHNPGAFTAKGSLDAQVKRKKERVEGVVEEETEYFAAPAAASAGGEVMVPMADALLKPLLGQPDFPDVLVV